jgi:hypothetical protein
MHEFVIIIIKIKTCRDNNFVENRKILLGRGYQHEKNTERLAESGRTVHRTGNGWD